MSKQVYIQTAPQTISGDSLFFCATKISERLAATIDSEEMELAEWVCREFKDRVLSDGVLWNRAIKAIGDKVAKLNRGRIGFGRFFNLDAKLPTDTCLGFIRISRANARHQCMHISIRKCHGYVLTHEDDSNEKKGGIA